MEQMTEQAGDAAEDAAEAGTTELCIRVAADGSLTVYQEAEGAAAGASQEYPAADIGEALQIVMQMHKGLQSKAQPGADFDAGFSGQMQRPGGMAGARGGNGYQSGGAR